MKKSLKKAVKWLGKSADKGLANSQLQLGVIYMHAPEDSGVKTDRQKASCVF